ncbi:MAG TPA: CopD family protein [Coxiellaceae bacterium]|nr:CopD family protein [Coxiellaceae bacterium]
MKWLLAFHLIFVVTWFAGLFYLPRLFVYHASAVDQPSCDRFKIMEHKLFWMIMTPAGILTTLFGHWLFALRDTYYLHQPWMLAKLSCVALLWFYHGICGFLVMRFKQNRNALSPTFYRFFNEVPTLLLFAIIILVVVQPTF